ncbi:MAG: Gfo/Idh/MocA family oxidoreductase [Gorillibacterium sp.]|nr:Gfo/Idh/MocA family oxidoreductase [Gorillibacterium sp.]
MKEQKKISWGILGPGNIAGQFVKDLVHAEGAQVVAVGSRTKANAERFAEKHGIPRAYGSYEELALDNEVEIIYVATPHPAHKDNVMTCLRAGKAVLCEKPFTMSANEARELTAYAEANKLFLMEAMWTRYLPTIRKVREWLSAGKIGEVRLLKADAGFRSDWNPEGRLLNPKLGGGALLDIGIYPISFASMIFGQAPAKIVSAVHLGETGVDEQFAVTFQYPNGSIANLNGSIRLQVQSDAYLYGTEGYIFIPNFLSARTATLFVAGGEPEIFADHNVAHGFAYEAEEAMQALREGRTASEILTPEETLQIMKTVDAIRAEWGLRYPFE